MQNWSLLFGVTLDQIWRRRNEAIFRDQVISITDVMFCAKRLVEGILVSHEVTKSLAGTTDAGSCGVSIWWNPPNQGEEALNCDGSVCHSTGHTACGGLLRDDNGCFIFGFATHLGTCTVI